MEVVNYMKQIISTKTIKEILFHPFTMQIMDSFKINLYLSLKITIDLDFVVIVIITFAFTFTTAFAFIIKIKVITFKFIIKNINSLFYCLMKTYFKDQN